MQLRNHIAYRFLTDDKLAHECLEIWHPQEYKRIAAGIATDEEKAQVGSLYAVISYLDQKAYYVTDTVISKLDLLKVTAKNGRYDWSVFKHLKPAKLTFIFPNNKLLRLLITEHTFHFCHVGFTYHSSEERHRHKTPGEIHWVMFFIDRETGERCEHLVDIDHNGSIEKFIYHLLCFFYLSENTEITVSAGKSYGTRKQPDALSNDTNVPVIIVNSNWNITSIRTEGFGFRGHFRLQPYPSENCTRMIFIQPFEKHGYVRHATKPDYQTT